MFDITTERPGDRAVIENLLDAAFGVNRHCKISYRYRDGVDAVADLRLVARERHRPGGYGVVGTLRFWPVAIGPAGDAALLLGPLAVAADWRRHGIGSALMRQGLDMAAWSRHRIVLLVGDFSFYGRFGFRPAAEFGIAVPGEKQERVLARALAFGAFAGVGGTVQPRRSVRLGDTGRGRAIAA